MKPNEMAPAEIKEVGIESLRTIIHTSRDLIVDIIVNAKDGISFDDIAVLKDNYEKIINAIKVFGEVPSEVMDLDMTEIKELIKEGMDLVFAIINAIKTPVTK